MSDDLIRRQAVIETILGCCPSDCDNEYECGYDDGLRQAVHRLKHLPSAQPERKKGQWLAIGNTGLAACECGFITDRCSMYNFCPNCGAEMEANDGEVH